LSASWRGGHLRVVAASGSYSSNLWALPIDPAHHNSTGAAVARVLSSSYDYGPSFSPDGTRLAFTSSRGGTQEEWLADADGGNPRQLTHLGAHVAGPPRWSPDGKRIVFHARVPDAAQIYVIDADDGLPRRITNGDRSFFMPTWSTDGRFVFVNSLWDGKNQAFRVRLADGDTEELFEGTSPVSTPDGKRILYSKSEHPGIFARALEGDPSRNPEERLVDDFVVPIGGMLPFPNGIYYTGVTRLGDPRAFRFFDYSTHRAKDIAPAPTSITIGLAVSPDQRELLYPAINDGSGDDLLLLEF
jgi:Tol biopolymer transport system component